MGLCAKKLISVSPHTSVLRGLWPGPNTGHLDCLFAINMKRVLAKEYKDSRGFIGE